MIKIGDVFRMCDSMGKANAFSDCRIVNIFFDGEAYADLVRPYVHSNGDSGVETLSRVAISRLNGPHWTIVSE